MPETLADGSWSDLLWRVLGNEEAMEEILNVPVRDVPGSALDSMRLCYHRFIVAPARRAKSDRRSARARGRDIFDESDTDSHPSQADMEDSGPSGLDTDGKKATSESAWGAILSLQRLERPEYIHAHLAKQAGLTESSETETERAQVMALLVGVGEPGEESAEKIGRALAESGEDVVKAFQLRVTYTMNVVTRSDMDRVRYCFTSLMWYDIVKIIRPDIVGRRLGPLVKEALRPLLAVVYGDDVDSEGCIDNILAEVATWCKNGFRLNKLCARYGESCIFVLAGKFSTNFLTTRFTTSGAVWDRALRHLDGLGLVEVAREGGLLELARGMRRELVGVFQSHLPAFMQQQVASA